MKIRIPEPVGRAWDHIGDVLNVPIWVRGRYEVRRIDIMLVVTGIGVTAYYWWTAGWMGALQGAVLYSAITAMALWML